jgi:hypothetical protein
MRCGRSCSTKAAPGAAISAAADLANPAHLELVVRSAGAHVVLVRDPFFVSGQLLRRFVLQARTRREVHH